MWLHKVYGMWWFILTPVPYGLVVSGSSSDPVGSSRMWGGGMEDMINT